MSNPLAERFVYFAPLDATTIQKILPHRYPFLLVDGITEFSESGVKGFKNLSIGEPVFTGHFPEEAIYPGVMQIETVAQVGACWILAQKENLGKIAYLMSVEEAKFRLPARPGMRLDIDGTITHLKSRTGRFTASVTWEGKPVSNVTVLFAFQKNQNGSGRE